jgi:hypothetical protein
MDIDTLIESPVCNLERTIPWDRLALIIDQNGIVHMDPSTAWDCPMEVAPPGPPWGFAGEPNVIAREAPAVEKREIPNSHATGSPQQEDTPQKKLLNMTLNTQKE